MSSWADLERELRFWDDTGQRPTFWWRDDDAIDMTPALERLLEIAERQATPVALAVIPEPAAPGLLRMLVDNARISVLQHGVSHRNHAPAGEKKAELGGHRSTKQVLSELAGARARLTALMQGKAPEVLVPPWNRIDPALARRLPDIGLHGLSTFGARSMARHAPNLVQANTHADMIDWKGSRGFAGTQEVLSQVVGHLEARRLGQVDAAEPTGLLTHHLMHDDACWDFVENLLEATLARSTTRWLDASDIFGPVAA
jgi:hypothetical protein